MTVRITTNGDALIRGGTVVDATGAQGIPGDVLISGERIVAAGKLDGVTAGRVVDAAGKVAAPGFIGFRELRDAGVTDSVPRMVAVQASGCAPIARAFDRGNIEVEAWDDPITVASGIRDPLHGNAEDGTLTLRRVRESGGLAIAVDDTEIVTAAHALACAEGVAAEPTGAVAVAGLRALVQRGVTDSDQTTVCLITGNVPRDTDAFVQHLSLPTPPVIAPELRDLRSVLPPGSGGVA